MSQKERFLDPVEKNHNVMLITGEPVSATISIAHFGDYEDLYPSSSFYLSFVTDYAKPTCLDYINSNIYSCILSLLKLHGTFDL